MFLAYLLCHTKIEIKQMFTFKVAEIGGGGCKSK